MAIENVRAIYFPYCIEKQEDGSWVLLNRNYKPVGFNTDEFIKYEEHPVSIKLKGIGPATLKRLSYKDEEPGDRVYLYNDGCVPTSSAQAMSSYLKKLEILLKLKSAYRDREEPHSSPLPHHAAYGSVLRGSADQAGSNPGKHKSE